MKWYWWLVIGLVFASGLWLWYIVSQKESVSKNMAKVREAKADKAILKSDPPEPIKENANAVESAL